MVPHKILVSQRSKFWRLRAGGMSIKEASHRAGFSESYGKGLVRHGRGDNSTEQSRPERFSRRDDAELASRPKRPYELSEVARDCLEDFARWRARYCGSLTVPWQEEAAYIVLAHLESDEDSYGVINAPQGGGKTRLFSHDIPVWLTCRDRSMRGCLMSGTLQIAERMTANLRTTFGRQTPAKAADRWKRRGMAMDAEVTLAQDYGRFKPSIPGIMWTRGEFSVEQFWTDEELADMAEYEGQSQDKESTWAAFSPDAQVMSLRFDFMDADDVHREKHMRNPDVMDDFFNWWEIEFESRLDPGGLLILTMQRLGANDVSRHLLDKIDPAFELDDRNVDTAPKQYFHVAFKAHYDDRCHGQHSTDAPAYPDGCMLDPKRLTWQKQNAKKTAGTYEVVYQQEDTDPASVLVNKVWVDGGEVGSVSYMGCWDDRVAGHVPTFPPGSFTVRYMTVDPSPTKFWSIQDWFYVLPNDGTEPLAGYRHLIDLCRDRMGANEFLDWSRDQNEYLGLAEDWVQRAKKQGYPITHLIMEKNAAQRWAMQYSFFHDWCRTRGIQVLPHETTANKADETYGVWATLPNAYRNGRVRLPGNRETASRQKVWPLVHEATTYPNSATDDCVMSQWFGEYNLQHLVHLRQPVGTIYKHIPRWAREMELTGAIR